LGADRWVTLAVIAASTGRLEFSEADSRNKKWVQKETLILRQIERELMYDLQKSKMLELASVSAWPSWDKEGKIFFTTLEAADRIWGMMWDRALPYQPRDKKKKDGAREEVQTWKERWEARFGKLDDPEVQDQQKKLEDMLKRQAIEATADRTRLERQETQKSRSVQSLYVTRGAKRETGDLRG